VTLVKRLVVSIAFVGLAALAVRKFLSA